MDFTKEIIITIFIIILCLVIAMFFISGVFNFDIMDLSPV